MLNIVKVAVQTTLRNNTVIPRIVCKNITKIYYFLLPIFRQLIDEY